MDKTLMFLHPGSSFIRELIQLSRAFDNLYINSVPGVIILESETSDSRFGRTGFPSLSNCLLSFSSSAAYINIVANMKIKEQSVSDRKAQLQTQIQKKENPQRFHCPQQSENVCIVVDSFQPVEQLHLHRYIH